MAALVLKAHDLIPKLTAVLTFPRNVILINQFGICWSAPRGNLSLGPSPTPPNTLKEEEAICLTKPFPAKDALA